MGVSIVVGHYCELNSHYYDWPYICPVDKLRISLSMLASEHHIRALPV